MSESEKILTRSEGKVRIVTINRPEVRNALDNEAALLLGQALHEFDADEAAHVCVLTGAGGAFCAGADLKALAGGTDYFPWAGSERGPLRAPLSKPVIGAIAGTACAGGLGVALFCDIRIAEESANFGVFSRRWGVPMSDGTTVRLPRLIGRARALDMLITGRAVPAREALEWGLVTRLAGDGLALKEAVELAQQVAEFPQIALRSDRRSAYEQEDCGFAAAIAREAALATAARRTEAMAGARRFADGKGRHGSFHDL
ncbi:MAG: crotonase/enoyl-CoA hydratase family protein [Reyranellaceae bacterium]